MDFEHDEENFEHDGVGRWPFHSFVEQLILDMFDPGWLLLFLFFLLRVGSVTFKWVCYFFYS